MRLLTLCLGAFACAVYGFAYEVSPSALVVLAGKTWYTKSQPLTRGQILPPDTQLSESGDAPSDLILGCGKSGWLSYSCRSIPCEIKACQKKDSKVQVYRVDPDPQEKQGASDSWFSSLFKREPATLAVLGVREGGSLTDSVIQQNGAEVHLAPALTRVLEGKYCLRFTPLPPGNPSLAKTVSIDWDRSNDAEGIVQLPNLKSGLYEIDKSDSEAGGNCAFQANPTPAWALVTPAANFAALAAQWKEHLAHMRDMERDGASPTVLLTVRHATLAHLADSGVESK